MTRDELLDLMNEILRKQNKAEIKDPAATLRGSDFRSLDFSEMALRVELHKGTPLEFDAGTLRQITTVSDVLDFFQD